MVDTGVSDSGSSDTNEVDTVSNNECPGGAGCPCNANDDCDGGLCLEGAGGKRCAKPCVDNCDKGYLCAQVPQGSDVVSVCVDAFARLCSPCGETKDCNYAGVNDARCVDRGNQGRYCGVGCATANDCPQGYVCEDVVDVDDNIVSQCMPSKTPEGSAGVCLCNANSVSLAYKTKCSKSLPGQSELSCPGEAQCKAVGKAAFCQAKAPKPESCDGLDNDCDGKTDEDSCDDGNPCTTDSCDGGGCKNSAAVDGGPCDDGSVCTLSDVCKTGTCTAGKPLVCDDGNACTTDSCDAQKGCSQVDFDGVPCDDDNPCTLGEVCGGGSCQPGKPKPCVSNDPCVLAKCDPKNGKCAYSDAGAGTPCDDSEPCTINESCTGGLCKGAPKACDDSDPCTAD
ncbi:MAG TPA: hypothetical protein DCQ06_01775, partial [Myxococcales bacterium]|nr:hypothetical protein [Myxococcales bacterium]